MRRFINLRTIGLFLLLIGISWSTSVSGQPPRKYLTVEEIYTAIKPYEKVPRALKWLPDGRRFSFVKVDREKGMQELWVESAETGKSEKLFSNRDLRYVTSEGDTQQVALFQYEWHPEGKGVLITDNGDLWYVETATEKVRRLTETEAEEELVDFSPDGNWISFVREYNLYVLNLSDGREIQLTRNGNKDLLNGKLDWVYQEELVGRGNFRAYWWSPDSRQIAYLQFDQSGVPRYPLVDWMPYHPEVEMMRYSKAGDPNAVVKLGVLPIREGAETTWLDSSTAGDVYFPRVYWLPDGQQLAYMRLDRLQQHLEFVFVNPNSGERKIVLQEEDPFWINIEDMVHFLKKHPQFIWGSEMGNGFRQLYLYDYDGKLLLQLTSGRWMVTDFLGVDEEKEWVYFTATEKDVLERHLYRVRLDGKKLQRLTNLEGSHRCIVSPKGKYYFDYYSNPMMPLQLTLHRGDGKQIKVMVEDQSELIADYALRAPEYFQFEGTNGVVYDAYLIKPIEFDPQKKYPVLIYVYGGPHAQLVRKAWYGNTGLWLQMMAQKGYIIFSMDNRGAGGRGHDWEKVVYRQLGKIELADQLEGVKYLKSLPFVDSTRIGIWGWSYGGYMTLYALTHSKAFRAGVSVAPVTDWRDYDTIYTERYMGLPSDNADGYRNSSPAFFADSLHGALLLVHGTADDNVHMQNSIQMVDALIDAGKQFELMMYPNQAHGISATKDRIHLFEMITNFLDRHLWGEQSQ